MGLLKRDNIWHKVWLLVRRICLKVPGAAFVCSCGRGTEDASRRDQCLLAVHGSGSSPGTGACLTSTAVEGAQLQPLKGLRNLDVLCKDSCDSVGNVSTWLSFSSISVQGRVRAASLSTEGTTSIPFPSQVASHLGNVAPPSLCGVVFDCWVLRHCWQLSALLSSSGVRGTGAG